jgi:hypothetical protein
MPHFRLCFKWFVFITQQNAAGRFSSGMYLDPPLGLLTIRRPVDGCSHLRVPLEGHEIVFAGELRS